MATSHSPTEQSIRRLRREWDEFAHGIETLVRIGQQARTESS
jgi:hypothetical protein